MVAVGVEMEPIVMAAPHGADGVRLLQHSHFNPAARRVTAQESPAGPAPMTMASEVGFVS